jgi:hypothetical protein
MTTLPSIIGASASEKPRSSTSQVTKKAASALMGVITKTPWMKFTQTVPLRSTSFTSAS